MPGWEEFARAYEQADRIKTREQASPVELEMLSLLNNIQETVDHMSQCISSIRSSLSSILRQREK